MRLNTSVMIAFMGLSLAAQTLDTKDFKPLPEVYSLKFQAQEKERADRDKKLAEIRQFMMADVEAAEQSIATQACKEVLNIELKDCAITPSQTGLLIGLRPGVKPVVEEKKK